MYLGSMENSFCFFRKKKQNGTFISMDFQRIWREAQSMVGRLQWIYQRHGWRAHSFGSRTIQDSCDIGGVFGSVVASNEGVIIQGDVYIYIASSSALIITYHHLS
jgi:hypothetical protein